MNRTGIPYLDFAWNPCGFGCSHRCPTCWARRQATAGGPTSPTCQDCRQFKVHFHPERLRDKLAPTSRRKPAVVGVQFLGDLFDQRRCDNEPMAVMDACLDGCQHSYVFLTQQYARARDIMDRWYRLRIKTYGRSVYDITSRCWYVGTTCCTQDAYLHAANLHGDAAWPWWVSMEPLAEAIEPVSQAPRPKGVIIGADNQRSANCGFDAIVRTARAFEAVGVPVFIKQLWLWHCPNCRETWITPCDCSCGTPASRMLFGLETDPARFPLALQMRQLPWALTIKREG